MFAVKCISGVTWAINPSRQPLNSHSASLHMPASFTEPRVDWRGRETEGEREREKGKERKRERGRSVKVRWIILFLSTDEEYTYAGYVLQVKEEELTV